MSETKLYNRIPLSIFWQLFVLSIANSQPIRTHSDYLQAALKAETVNEIITYGQKACELASKEQQFVTATVYYFQISNTLYQREYYLPGIRQAQKGLATANRFRITSDTLLFKYYGLLASMYSRLTMNDSASYWYNQAEKLLVPKSRLIQLIPEFVDAHYYNQAFFLVRLGDQERAVGSIRKSIELAQTRSNKQSIALSYQQLANIYFLSYQYALATLYYRKALTGFDPKSVDMCWGYTFLGNCLRADGKFDEGLRWLRLGTKSYSAIVKKKASERDVDFETEGNYYLGKCEQLMGFDQEATQSFQTSIHVYQRSQGTRGELIAASWSGLAAIALKQHQITKAFELTQQALIASTVQFSQLNPTQNPTVDDIKAGKPLYEALRLKGAIWYQLYKKNANPKALAQSIQCYRTGLLVAQRIRRSFSQLESTYFFNEKIKPCVSDALNSVFDVSDPKQVSQQATIVFDLLQSYQSMGMADALHNRAIKKEVIPIAIRQQEQDLRQQLTTTGTQLLDTMPAASRRQVINRLSEIKRKLYLFEDTLGQQYPNYYRLKYDTQTMRVGELQKKLENHTAYLSYFLSNDFIYGFFATNDRTVVFRRLLAPNFIRLVAELRAMLETSPGMFDYEGRAVANQLFDYLIRPIESYLTATQRLIIERDDILNNLPFEVLEPSEAPEAYLCKRFALSYSYAAKLTFTSSTNQTIMRSIGFAPYSEDSLAREMTILPSRILKKSAEEVRASGSNFYVNANATKKRLLAVISSANLVHLATHATANDEHPEASAIGFYPKTTDSLLRALEIVNLPLDHIRLVILSACEGNGGILRKAEGLLSLARAFRLAGCPTILTTSWEAHNETTSELIKLFYRHLHQGLPADIALQRARLDYFASPAFNKWGHPYHWANFTLIGNPNVTFLAAEPLPGWQIVLLAIGSLLAISGGVLLVRRLVSKPVF